MKFHQHARQHSVLLRLSAVCLGMFMAVTAFAWFSGSAQNKMKVIEQRRFIRPDIVPIVAIEVDKKPLSLGKAFEASGDWLRSAKFKLRNDSGKEIVHILFELEFPETISSGNVMAFPISVGHRPGSIVFDAREPLSFKPNKELTISVDELTYARLVQFIELRHSMSSISKVITRVEFVAFDDDTGWSEGEYLRQDPKNPRAYVPIGSN